MRNEEDKKQFKLLNCSDALKLPQLNKKVKFKTVNKKIVRRSRNDQLFDNLIDVETTAEVLGIAPKTIRKWVSIRYIPYVKVGRRVMFRPESLELWLNRKEIKSWPS